MHLNTVTLTHPSRPTASLPITSPLQKGDLACSAARWSRTQRSSATWLGMPGHLGNRTELQPRHCQLPWRTASKAPSVPVSSSSTAKPPTYSSWDTVSIPSPKLCPLLHAQRTPPRIERSAPGQMRAKRGLTICPGS